MKFLGALCLSCLEERCDVNLDRVASREQWDASSEEEEEEEVLHWWVLELQSWVLCDLLLLHEELSLVFRGLRWYLAVFRGDSCLVGVSSSIIPLLEAHTTRSI